MRIDVSAVNREMQNALKRIAIYDGKTRIRVEEAVKKGANLVRKNMLPRIPVRRGNLKRSAFVSFRKSPLAAYVGVKAPYGHLIEYGVKAKEVYPNPVMRINTLTLDPIFTRRSILIPARRAHPFLGPAFEESKPQIIRMIREALRPGA